MRGTEFAELSAFIAVAEQGNFAKAAIQLGIVPSTLSQTIRNLEERLGVRLLNRTTRSVALTEAGERLLNRSRPAFLELQEAVESIGDFRNTPTGTLRLSVSSVPAQLVLAPLIKQFLMAYPAISLEIIIDNTDSDIVSGRFDAGIRYGMRIEKDMMRVLASPASRLIVIASPDYLQRHAAPQIPQDLQMHNCIRLRKFDQNLVPWLFEKDQNVLEVAVNGSLIVNDIDLLIKAVKDGIGIGCMVEAYVAEEIRQGVLIPLLLDWSTATHSYYLYYANRHQLPVPLKIFIQFLRAHLKKVS
ncbi:LysR substrate-binding domain-containing protein [Alkanindiges illinoisensis]|uniref:LysR substrate-binding domain-containing protein n=1 Tax=Alkanindiges illinoisensis TaxID=197183 RepID=UPI000478EBA9|nr:LysR substrate-binding domain-containing protein [Alkanindiges illinoisensis]